MSIEAPSRPDKRHKDIPIDGNALREMLGSSIAREMRLPSGEMIQVVDTEILVRKLRDRFGHGAGRSDADTTRLVHALATLFEEPVLTEDQVREGVIEPKPLFYFPRDADDATRGISVKNARFHLLSNEALESLRLRPQQPTRSDSEPLSLLEATAAVYVLHPEYGDGFRDEKGVLYVRGREKREYKKFSGTFFEEMGIHKGYFLLEDRGNKKGNRSLRDGIAAELPHLVANNILIPLRDFKQVSYGSDDKESRIIEREGVSSSGARMIGGVLHYIGREFYGKPVNVARISPALGGVIDKTNPNEPRVVALFSIVDRDHARKGKSAYLANKNLTNPRPFSAQAIGLTQLSNETNMQFVERCEAVDRGIAHLILDIAKTTESVARLFLNPSPSLLAEVAKTAYWLQKEGREETFDTFVRTYGYDGLRTFLSLEYDRSMGDKILEFAQSGASEDIKRGVFEFYGRIIDAADGDAASAMIAEKMGKAARDVLVRAHQYKDEPEKIRKMLEKISVEGQVLLGTFRALAGEKKVQAVTEVAGVEYRQLNGVEVLSDAAIRDSLEALYRSNYSSLKTQETLIAEFRKNLGAPGAVVHRVQFRGKVVAFMLIVPTGEKRLHVSALNVDPELVGVKAGPELLKKVLELVREGNTIEAEAVPRIADQYEMVYGFQKVGEFTDDDGVELFKLELRPPSKETSSTAPQKENGEANK